MQVVTDQRALLLRVRHPDAVKQFIPRSKILPPEIQEQVDGHNVSVYHGLEEFKVLRNLNIKAPSPIMYYYDWPGKYTPFAHQKETSAFLTLHHRAFVLNEMGTSKTASNLWAADFLMQQGAIRKVLVLSPLSTLELVWLNEVFAAVPHRSAVVLHGSAKKRFELLEQDADFYIMNHDGLKVTGMVAALSKKAGIDLIIVDEASVFRNAGTKSYKLLKSLITPRVRLWLNTGTPCPNAPTDSWALARLVCPDRVPQFFATYKRQLMMQITQYKWKAKPEAYEMAFQSMQPAIRYKKSECLDLPPVMYENRECELSEDQKHAYKVMKSKIMSAQIEGEQITAVNAADQINKLRQILCGVVKNPETGEYLELDHSPRTRLLLEVIEEADAKVLVVVPFKGIIETLAKEVGKSHSVAVLNGDVSRNERTRIVNEFKTQKDPHVLLCHPKVMAHGLNLVEADTMVFYAPIYSNDEALQVVERFNRAGQTRKMTVVKIGGHPLEWGIYDTLNSRKTAQETILDLYKKELQM